MTNFGLEIIQPHFNHVPFAHRIVQCSQLSNNTSLGLYKSGYTCVHHPYYSKALFTRTCPSYASGEPTGGFSKPPAPCQRTLTPSSAGPRPVAWSPPSENPGGLQPDTYLSASSCSGVMVPPGAPKKQVVRLCVEPFRRPGLTTRCNTYTCSARCQVRDDSS